MRARIGKHPAMIEHLQRAWHECGGTGDDHICDMGNEECWGNLRDMLARAWFKFSAGVPLTRGEAAVLGRYFELGDGAVRA